MISDIWERSVSGYRRLPNISGGGQFRKEKGKGDARSIWQSSREGVETLMPSYVFLISSENFARINTAFF